MFDGRSEVMHMLSLGGVMTFKFLGSEKKFQASSMDVFKVIFLCN